MSRLNRYKLNEITLVPDEYGFHMRIKKVTKVDGNGEYIKHVKITEELVNIIKNNLITTEYDG